MMAGQKLADIWISLRWNALSSLKRYVRNSQLNYSKWPFGKSFLEIRYTNPDDPEPGKGMALVRSLKDLLELSKLTKENWDLWIPTISEFFRIAVESTP